MPPDVTDAELAVLQALWERGEATIRDLADALYPGGKASQYATVQKLLERLEAKEPPCVRRDRGRWPHVFTPAVDRETLIGWRLRDTAEKLCGGSLTPLLLHLLRAEDLSADERRELWAFLDQLKRSKRPNDSGS
jgi:BlaI family transcriptional regulator, penicillinase repressor